jgi:hypothetical protein
VSDSPITLSPYSVPELLNKGLSEPEAVELAAWVDQGKPGLVKHRAQDFGSVYALGYSCQDLAEHLSIPLPILLYARVYYSWDKIRAEHITKTHQQNSTEVSAAQSDSIKFMTEIIAVTHKEWRSELLRYALNPKTESRPAWLPDSLPQYQRLQEILKTLLEPVDAGKANPASPVSVMVGAGGTVQVVDGNAVKAALMKDVSSKK